MLAHLLFVSTYFQRGGRFVRLCTFSGGVSVALVWSPRVEPVWRSSPFSGGGGSVLASAGLSCANTRCREGTEVCPPLRISGGLQILGRTLVQKPLSSSLRRKIPFIPGLFPIYEPAVLSVSVWRKEVLWTWLSDALCSVLSPVW